MSKYYKAEDVIHTIADQWRFEAEMESPYPTEDIEEFKKVARKLFADLLTIDIVRCRDCKWAKPNKEGDYDCKCHIPIFRVPADGWCYLGERIDE